MGSGAASAARGARPHPSTAEAARSGRSLAASRLRATLRPRRPDFPSRSFPSRPRRRPSPGFLTRRAAKIARGRISAPRRPDPAGRLGSIPRPTAEGPGSGRARSPGCPQAPLSCTLPPLRFPSRPPPVGGVSKSKLQLRGWDFSGSSLSQPCSLGMGIISAIIAVAVELGGGRCEEGVTPPSASQPNLPGFKHWKLPGTFPTLCSVAKRSRPGLSLWPLHGASKQACSWLGDCWTPGAQGTGGGPGCLPCRGHVCGAGWGMGRGARWS